MANQVVLRLFLLLATSQDWCHLQVLVFGQFRIHIY